MWFCGVFSTLIDNDIRHHSGQNVVDSLGAADCDISSIRIDNAEPHSMFVTTIVLVKKIFTSEHS